MDIYVLPKYSFSRTFVCPLLLLGLGIHQLSIRLPALTRILFIPYESYKTYTLVNVKQTFLGYNLNPRGNPTSYVFVELVTSIVPKYFSNAFHSLFRENIFSIILSQQ